MGEAESKIIGWLDTISVSPPIVPCGDASELFAGFPKPKLFLKRQLDPSNINNFHPNDSLVLSLYASDIISREPLPSERNMRLSRQSLVDF